jgi:FkbH-like protein
MTAGFFEAVTFSAEDRMRVEQYAANRKRETLAAQSRDIGEFLRSLQMEAIFTSSGKLGWSRFTQLINKSNQFNLTTRRYTEAEIIAMAGDPSTLTMQVRLTDRFGDNGMISALICKPDDYDWIIDTWVMSCRVLGREVEQAVLNRLVDEALAIGIRRLIGIYRPTERNGLVAGHYTKLGFALLATEDGDRWVLDLADYRPCDVPIAIKCDSDAH